VVVIPPGVLVNTHVSAEGKLLNITLPVAEEQVGCVMVPTIGAVGVTGWALITTLADVDDTQFNALVTV